MGAPVGDVEPLPGLVGFTHALRRAGLTCDAQRTAAYLTAVAYVDVADPGNLYWAGRVTLCAQPDDLPAYDEAFAAWFSLDWQPPRSSPAGDDQPDRRTTTTATVLPAAGQREADGDRTPVPVLSPSDTEVL